MWVIGGLGESGSLNDSWSSPDGVTWTEVTGDAPFPARFGHTSVVFDGRMWVIGGYADDGTGTYVYKNDVWSSPDGVTWTEETDSASFPARNFHSSVVFDGRMWVIGGTSDNGDFQDVWSSSDGVAWSEENDSAFSSARYGSASVADGDGIWVISGFGNSANLQDVWSSSDGVTWTEETDDAPFPGRNSPTALIFDDRIWVIGGLGDSGSLDDVWFSSLAAAPAVSGITPASGINTGPVTVTNLAGSGFAAGATVKFNRTGSPDIEGTGVSVESATKISCTFNLTGAAAGVYNVVVINPDGQAGMLSGGFTVTGNPPVVTGIVPATGVNTGNVEIMELSGSSFESGANVVLNRTGYAGIIATDVVVADPATITCTFDLTGASPGTYNVVVANPDGQQGMLAGGFVITAPPLSVTTVVANTTIDGLTVTESGGVQSVAVDAKILPSALIPNNSVLEIQPPADRGFRNITVYAFDGTGFSRDGDMITGAVTGVLLESEEISPGGYSLFVGPQPGFSYTLETATFPKNAVLVTKMWEGATGDDRSAFLKIAYGNDASYLGTAYTVKIIKTGIPFVRRITLRCGVNASWNPSFHDGQSRVFIQRISDDRSQGEVLHTRYLSYDSGNGLEYYEADSPRGLSTFGLSSLSGNNNPFQLIVLAVSSYVNEGQSEPTQTVTVTTVPVTPAVNVTQSLQPPASPEEKSVKLYTNPDGVITQATHLQSPDGFTTVSIGTGIVAKDREGGPLSSITLKTVPSGTLPGTLPEGGFVFTGRACDLSPEGAFFSPAATVIFRAPPDIRFDEDFAVKIYDHATGTWEDVPASFDRNSMTITAQVSHFCCVALFTKTVAAEPSRTAPPARAAQVPETPKPSYPSTAMDIFTGMMLWAGSFISGNMVLVVAVIVVISAGVIFAVRKR